MELLLNLLWLLLVVPAYWVWRRQDRSLRSMRGSVVLACMLVLLFPVISATDDMHAMRQETEESSPLKRALKHGNLEKASGQNHLPGPPADLTFIFAVRPCIQFCGHPRIEQFFTSAGLHIRIQPTRAPPVSFLG